MNKIKNIILTISLLNCSISNSQDFHSAQFDACPLLLNPALTGERINEPTGFRVHLNYRDQKSNFSSGIGSYRTTSFGFDFRKNDRLFLGLSFSNNRSINNLFSVNKFMLSGAYNLMKDPSNRQTLVVGAQIGLINFFLSSQNFTYNNQYSSDADDGFNRNLPSGETLINNASYQLCGNTGVYYRNKLNSDKMILMGGFSIYNITKSVYNLYSQSEILPLKFTIHGGVEYKMNPKVKILPQFLFMEQKRATELNIGTLINYEMSKGNTVIGGLSWRQKNAVIAHFGCKIKDNTIRVSYCLIGSYLYQYNNSGFEISLIHIASKQQTDR